MPSRKLPVPLRRRNTAKPVPDVRQLPTRRFPVRSFTTAACLGLFAFATTAMGQSINIRFGSAASVPPATYAAAGLAGTWNSFLVTPDYGIQSLVSLAG